MGGERALSHDELLWSSAVEQARSIREGSLSPVELVELYLRRIEEHDRLLNAFVTVAGDQAVVAARDAADVLTATRDRSVLPPFHGVPIAIKDLNDTAGIRTTYGLADYADHVPGEDDHVVSRLRTAGFVILGKTNAPEQGLGCTTEPPAYGPTRNPWNHERTPGGSSGGAAAALAAGMTPAAQGSDGGGSIRIPAGWCGLVGVKPSRGRVLTPAGDAEIQSTQGPLAWSVEDAAALLDAMTGPEITTDWWGLPPEPPFARQVSSDPTPLRIAVSGGDVELPVRYRQVLDETAGLLSDLGHEVEPASPGPRWPQRFYDEVFTDARLRAALSVGRIIGPTGERVRFLHPATQWLTDIGSIDAVELLRIQREVGAILADWCRQGLALFDRYDALLTPTTAEPPLRVGLHEELEPGEQWHAMFAACPYTTLFNVTGQPAVSLPLGVDGDGLPVGMQLVMRPGDEATMFRLAGQLERARPWTDRRPPASWDDVAEP